jgi:hypothetical protein
LFPHHAGRAPAIRYGDVMLQKTIAAVLIPMAQLEQKIAQVVR